MLKHTFFFFSFILTFSVWGQVNKVTLNGQVKDSTSAETITGAIITLISKSDSALTSYNAFSNAYGFYSITVPKGIYDFQTSSSGFMAKSVVIELNENKTQDVYLSPQIEDLGIVEIVAGKNENVKKIDISTQTMTSQTIKKIPAFLGEADVIKSVQLLPGVTSVGEGATGFNVRGGSIDQNLILLDEAPVFNSSHLFGFFSVFNPDAVKDVQLVKGGIPANYGGRLSSTLDVRMKEGNKRQTEITGGIGTIFSRFTIEGPVIKNRASYIISARRSYIDVLAKPFLSGALKDSRFNFYDLTGKINYKYGKNTFFVSGYLGNDVFSAADAFGFIWGNATATARWNRVINRKLFSNITYYYSRYRYNIEFGNRGFSFNWKSFIINNSLKADFNWFVTPKNNISFGGQSTYYNFKPGNAIAKNNTNSIDSRNFSLPDKFAMENAIYISDDFSASTKWSFRGGIRLSQFMYLGKGKVFEYTDPANPGERRMLNRVWVAEKNESIADYLNLEPRFGFKYQPLKQLSIKGGYNRMVQNLHLISNTTASVPFDVWQPSTNNIKPEIADQITLGIFKNFGETDDFEASIEIYYKDLQNQIDYVDGADLLLNELLEADLLYGPGRAYGTEFYLKKNTGKLNGWIAYTLSKSERKIEGINNGIWFPNRFDRTHNLNLVLNYKLTEKWELAGNFVFSSGTPATFYNNQYFIQGYIVPDLANSARNNVRNPAYHRLDLSVTYNKKKKGKWESQWVFSVYNAYNRRNPFSVYFDTDYQDKGYNQAIRYSVIGSFIPAISYNFKWK